MAIIDEFKSEKNRGLIIQASTKMLLEKYNLSLSPDVLQGIIQAIIMSMSKDAILMNDTIKLMELNTITLTKMKDYITKNIEAVNAPVAPAPVAQAQVVEESIANAANAAGYNKGDILTNEELLLRVKEYEHSRVISNTVLTNIETTVAATATDNAIAAIPAMTTASAASAPVVADIMEKVISSLNTSTNKKTLIINSYSRDWINFPSRNQLSFTVNIDLQSNIIEPLKILFPTYVKDMTPYIVLVITDNHKTFKYNFLYSKSSGKWDIWKLINKDNNINNNINLANKKWRIHFLDYLNHELDLGRDDIKISQINEYQTHNYDNKSMDTSIDTILMPSSHQRPQLNLYEADIDYSNQFEYDEYKLNNVSKYDYMQLKTYRNTYVNMKVVEVNNNLGKIIMLNEMKNEPRLTMEDFTNASLLNYGSQYSIILTYYPIRNV
jgi:hypothetical protein